MGLCSMCLWRTGIFHSQWELNTRYLHHAREPDIKCLWEPGQHIWVLHSIVTLRQKVGHPNRPSLPHTHTHKKNALDCVECFAVPAAFRQTVLIQNHLKLTSQLAKAVPYTHTVQRVFGHRGQISSTNHNKRIDRRPQTQSQHFLSSELIAKHYSK